MAKFKALKGIANNLADGFTSATHIDLVNSLPSPCEIDIFNKSATPDASKPDRFNKILDEDRKWFLEQIKKVNIDLDDIDKVSIKIEHKPGKALKKSKVFAIESFSSINCTVLITAKGKEYKGSIGAK